MTMATQENRPRSLTEHLHYSSTLTTYLVYFIASSAVPVETIISWTFSFDDFFMFNRSS